MRIHFFLQQHPFILSLRAILLIVSAQGGTAAHVVNYHLPGSVKHQIPQYNIVFDECSFVRNGHLTTKDHVQLLGCGTLYIAENALTLVKDSEFLHNHCSGITAVQSSIVLSGSQVNIEMFRRTIPFICGILVLIQLPALVWYIFTNSGNSYSYEFNEISPSTPSLLPALLLPTLSPLPVEYPSPIQTDCSSIVHVAMVAPGKIGSRHLYTTIKSILMHRSTPLHFHFITDNRTMTVLKTMITTWALPAISQDYYDIHKAWTRISSSLNDSQTNCSQALSIQLNLHLILPNCVGHVLVIEPSSVAIIDLAQLIQ